MLCDDAEEKLVVVSKKLGDAAFGFKKVALSISNSLLTNLDHANQDLAPFEVIHGDDIFVRGREHLGSIRN